MRQCLSALVGPARESEVCSLLRPGDSSPLGAITKAANRGAGENNSRSKKKSKNPKQQPKAERPAANEGLKSFTYKPLF